MQQRCQDTENHQNCVDYNLVNEQEQSRPQRIHARQQGTQSPQISVTLILRHSSGAEVLARKLIGTCTQMEPITENVTLLPLLMSDDLITIISLPGVDPLLGSPVIGLDD